MLKPNESIPRRSALKLMASVIPLMAGFTHNGLVQRRQRRVMTVNGLLDASLIGTTLAHEHILVDFIGAGKIDPSRWDREVVTKKVLPYLGEVKNAGCKTLVDCTPNYLGRDVVLLQKLSALSGLNIITNTGYYGGSDNKFLPAHAFTETAEQLADRWVAEYKHGIGTTGIKPGFIKISVNAGPLTEVSRKLIRAAAITHLETGLAIASHTGPAVPAFEEIEILRKEGVHPNAFIWVHAQHEKDWRQYSKAAEQGAWISLDGLNENNPTEYTQMLSFLKNEKCLDSILVSHDAGWYDPAKPDGGEFRGYTTLFKKLIPALEQIEFKEKDIRQLIQINPQKALSIKIRKL